MSILNRYLRKETTKYLILVLVTVIAIYLAVDFFEKIDNFLEKQLPVSRALVYLALKIPFITSQIAPIGILLTVIIVFGLMNRQNEIIALKSSGVSIFSIIRPIIWFGFGACIILFCFTEVIVPLTMAKANRIWLFEVKGKQRVVAQEENIWYKSDGAITHIKYYHPRFKSIFGVTINFFDENFRLVRRLDAKRGSYKEDYWELYSVMEQTLTKNKNGFDVTFYEKRSEPIDLDPEDLTRAAKKSNEMNIAELWRYIEKVEDEGYDASNYQVDLYAKMAFPVSAFLMSLVGSGLALRANPKEGIGKGIGYGLVVAFIFWMFHSFCVSLGYGEMLPPVLAAWLANLVLACFGGLTLITAE